MKTEKLLLFVIISGMLLKAFHIPGGSTFLILDMFLLSFLYFPFGFYFLSDSRKNTLGFSIVSGLMLSTLVLGILFNIMHWTGALNVIVFGALGCVPIGVVAYLKYAKNKLSETSMYYKNILIRVVCLSVIALVSFLF